MGRSAFKWLSIVVIRGAGGIASLGLTFVAAKFMGAQEAGFFFVVVAVATVLCGLGRLGLDNVVLREVAGALVKREQPAAYMSVALKIAFISCATLGLVIFLMSSFIAEYWFEGKRFIPLLRLICPFMVAYGCAYLLGQGFVGLGLPNLAVAIQNILVPLLALGWILILGDGATALSTMMGYVLASVVVLGVSWAIWIRITNVIPGESVVIASRQMLSSAKPLLVVIAMSQLMQWSPQIIAGLVLSPGDAALIAASQRTAMVVGLLLVAVNFVVAPSFVSCYQREDIVSLKRIARGASRALLLAVSPLAVAGIAFAGPLMSLFGSEFRAAGYLFCAFIIGQWFNASTGPVGLLLNMTGHDKDLRDVTMFSGVVLVASCLIFGSISGVIGIAVAASSALVLQNVLFLLKAKRRLGFWAI